LDRRKVEEVREWTDSRELRACEVDANLLAGILVGKGVERRQGQSFGRRLFDQQPRVFEDFGGHTSPFAATAGRAVLDCLSQTGFRIAVGGQRSDCANKKAV